MTFDCTKLPGHLRSICDGTHVKATGVTHTLDERRVIIGRYLSIDASGIQLAMPSAAARTKSNVGTRLHAIIERDAGKIECGECRDEVTRLNLLTPEEVRAERETVASGIVSRAKLKAPKFWQRWGAKLAPDTAKQRALAWIDEACGTVQNDKGVHPLNFVTNITVGVRVAKRKTPRLSETIASIIAAGFPKPIVFAEPDSGFDADFIWPEKLGASRSFMAMCDRLVESPSEWLMLCEDDVLLSSHTADYLRTINVSDEVMSLYVPGPKQVPVPGWNKCGPSFVGSLALVMRRTVLYKIMQTKAWREWDRHDCVDRLIRAATREAGIAIMLPNPSLCQHVGDTPAIYEDRKITSIREANDWKPNGSYTPQSVTLITPTGDRQDSFRMCERWMGQQNYTGPVQWIVVDDGVKPTTVSMGQHYIRESPVKNHSLCRNLRSAIPHAVGDIVFVIEDDDYYHPHYLSTMAGRLRQADLVGEFGAKYYYIRHRRWRHRHGSEMHASLCRTGMTRAVLPTFAECAEGAHPSVDLRLWSEWKGSKLSWKDEAGDQSLCVGIKGVRGRQSSGWRPVSDSLSDPDGVVLKRWVGPDYKYYLG